MQSVQATKFSVIIPTRERSDTLQSSLKTCVGQDYDNLEIIVSDNFSTDNTREVVESFDDPRIRYINTGTWTEPTCCYILLVDGKITMFKA